MKENDFLRILIFLFLFYLIACDKASELATLNSKLVITGRVVEWNEGNFVGVAGAKIFIKSQEGFLENTSKEDKESTAEIDESGMFSVSGVIARGNDLELVVTKNSGEDSDKKTENEKTYSKYIRTISTVFKEDEYLPARQIDLGEIEIVPNNEELKVTVFGLKGTVKGIEVILENTNTELHPEAGRYRKSAITNDDGIALFTQVPAADGFIVYNIPFKSGESKAVGSYQYDSVLLNDINLSIKASRASRVANLVLGQSGFDLVYYTTMNFKNRSEVDKSTTEGIKYFTKKELQLIKYYFNLPVNSATASVRCRDLFAGGTIPMNISFDTKFPTIISASPIDIKVNEIKENQKESSVPSHYPFISGHTYSCSIRAKSDIWEDIKSADDTGYAGGDKFYVTDETDPDKAKEKDLSLKWEYVASAKKSDYKELASVPKVMTDTGTKPFQAVFSFFNIGASTYEVFVRHGNEMQTTQETVPNSINGNFDLSNPINVTFFRDATDWKNPASSKIFYGRQLKNSDLRAGQGVKDDKIFFIISEDVPDSYLNLKTLPYFGPNSLQNNVEPGQEASLFLLVRACNFAEKSPFDQNLISPDSSSDCKFSSILELNYTR